MSVIDSVRSKLFGSVKASLAAFQGERTRLEREDAALGVERDGLLTMPTSSADVQAGARTLVATRQATLRATIGRECAQRVGGGLLWGPPDGGVSRRAPTLPDSLASLSGFDLACLLMPDLVVAGLEALAPADGLTVEARLARIREIDVERARLAREHTELCDAAARMDPPLVVPLLPEVAAARRAEQTARERAERVAVDEARNASLRGR